MVCFYYHFVPWRPTGPEEFHQMQPVKIIPSYGASSVSPALHSSTTIKV